MTLAVLLAALSVAFPKPGIRLPPVTECYMIGATDSGATNVVVAGVSYPVYRTGAWAAMAAVTGGVNVVTVTDGTNRVDWTVEVERPRPAPKSAPGVKPPPSKPKVYEKLAYAKDEARPSPVGKAPGDVTIWLDPGHGGAKDLGAVSPHGWDEKEANLLLALEVRRALEECGFRVEMTRTNDVAVQLFERARPAHAGKADAFVSIHHNAPAANRPAGEIRFSSVYAWNPLGDALAKAVAARMRAKVEHANFAVTRSPEIPSCLVEADFVTHPVGEESVWNAANRRMKARQIADGILDWCNHSPSDPSAGLQVRNPTGK